MDASFFKPFIEGTLNTFKVQCKTSATHEAPFFKGTKPQPDFAIAGVIGITSAKFTGTITLCFPEKVFLGMMERMLDEKFAVLTDELQDGVAEMLNIIFGHAKVILNQQGHTIQKAIPTVIRGDKIHTSHLSASKVVVLSFVTDLGTFQIEICSEVSL
jgi:CheY-specific phosphatase CheX